MSKTIKVSINTHNTLLTIKKTKGYNSLDEVIQTLLPLVTIRVEGDYTVLHVNAFEVFRDKDSKKVIREARNYIEEMRVVA